MKLLDYISMSFNCVDLIMTRTIYFLLLISFTSHSKLVVKYPVDGRDSLFHQAHYETLLKTALQVTTESFGEYELVPVKISIDQSKMDSLINKRNTVNIYWTMTSSERERLFNVVRVPLFSGLGGCRLFLIDSNREKDFEGISSINELKKFAAGQGYNWPDSKILESNGIPLVKVEEHESLHRMLSKKRFDYFPRAAFEIFEELDNYPRLSLVKSVGFYYQSPFFFFTPKEERALSERLEAGLNEMISNGSYAQLLDKNDLFSNAKLLLKNNQFKFIELENPDLTNETQASVRKYSDFNVCKSFDET